LGRVKLEWDCDWDVRKRGVARNILARELSFLRGVANVSDIVPLDAPSEPAKKRFRLVCNRNPFGKGRCGAEWESDVFTECPKCGARIGVKKIDQQPAVQPEVKPEVA